jgi:hypothetical protein
MSRMRRGKPRKPKPPQLLVGALLLLLSAGPVRSASAAGPTVTEDFSSASSGASGTTLGACKQLTIQLANSGSVSTAGTGEATISTPLATDAALLASTHPLPGGAYTVSVDVTNIHYAKSATAENGVTLLALTDIKPLPGPESWWAGHRLIGVEVNVFPGSTSPYPLYITYSSGGGAIYSWSGAAWATGAGSYKPALIFDPAKSYTVSLERGAGAYTVRVAQGGTLLVQASVPLTSVKTAASAYVALGDRLTDAFTGWFDVTSVTLPRPASCGATGDAGPLSDGALDAQALDAQAPDAQTLDAQALDVQVSVPDVGSDAALDALQPALDATSGDSPVASWELSTPDGVAAIAPAAGDEGGCGCRLGGPTIPPGAGWVLLALLVLSLRPRRAP